jgi:ribosomal protein S21
VAYISVNNNESIESALRRFKRKVITEEIIKDLKNTRISFRPDKRRNSNRSTPASVTASVFVRLRRARRTRIKTRIRDSIKTGNLIFYIEITDAWKATVFINRRFHASNRFK